MMVMMKAIQTIRVRKGRVNEVLSRFRTPLPVYAFEGFLLMEVLIKDNSQECDELQVCTTWEDRRYFDKWSTSRAARTLHSKVRELKPEDCPIIGSELDTYEIAAQYEPPGQKLGPERTTTGRMTENNIKRQILRIL
ncbi:antibiotic biosynthesis monooxygenase [Paenibacillus woosongensis]|uniref:ABM domain-containing protein n=1 Tax=Paenibacillus woosongensis TaxID=307580 RepID=A0A7X3CPA7_9BACL|nr:antibiotic biosynthesis monooxygenase [Paenibacillus woosongensis]MUG46679.1 hypothetical protein [Paenibacillus woosongensis]